MGKLQDLLNDPSSRSGALFAEFKSLTITHCKGKYHKGVSRAEDKLRRSVDRLNCQNSWYRLDIARSSHFSDFIK
jgi:hypothetical protein